MEVGTEKQRPLKAAFSPGILEVGCDEAGRGCLAGPVFAAAVILPEDFEHPLLQDSKKMRPAHRARLREIIELEALDWAVAQVSPAMIDQINILQASIRAMHLAMDQLRMTPSLILVDGNQFLPYKEWPHRTVVGGDGLYASIAAASVLAKTHRDAYMESLDLDYPQYGWKENKGYGTRAHRRQMQEHGLSPHHRKSFRWQEVEQQPLIMQCAGESSVRKPTHAGSDGED